MATAGVALAAVASSSAIAATAEPYFVPTGSMTTTRSRAATAPLPDGRVLIAGGYHYSAPFDTGSALKSAEIYDPATGTFTETGSMLVRRMATAAAPLPGGRVLIAGGLLGDTAPWPLASTEVYDPTTGTFSAGGSMAIGRQGLVAAPLPDGRVLVAGGGNASFGQGETHTAIFASAEIYDPSTNSFSSAGAMTSPRVGAAAAPLLDGRVLIAGGYDGESFLSSAEIFSPEDSPARAFRPTGAMTSADSGEAATLSDGSVLMFGRQGMQKYDPIAGTFSAILPGSPLRQRAIAPLPKGRLLLAGGTGTKFGLTDEAEIYVSAPSPQSAGLNFGPAPPFKTSPVESLTVTNLGAQELAIDKASLAGSDAADFEVVDDGCSGGGARFRRGV